jgi:N4-gp56 family major capsid protein
MTSINWTDTGDGYMYDDELSDELRTSLQPNVYFRQFCEPDKGALGKGLHRGNKYRWNVYGNVATQGRALSELSPMPETNFSVDQAELTITEYGNSVPYTGKLTALSKHSVLDIIHKGLKNDARKAFDIAAWEQFDTCKLRAAASTSTTSVTVTEDASTVTTNNVNLGTGHVKAIVDNMRERNIPGYVSDDYIALAHPTTFRPIANELETIHQYTPDGQAKIYNGEKGRYEGTRFCEQNFIPKGGAIDSTTHDPYTGTADAWDNAKSGWAFFFGADTVNEAPVVPENVRAKLPGDYGRSGGIAWYSLTGFGIFHTVAAQSRIFKWDSAA